MAFFSAFSVTEALDTLATSVPDWNKRLEELNSQIAERQLELARLTENDRPPTRSVKNKGSTESLRPRDDEEENQDPELTNPFDTPPKSKHNDSCTSPTAAARSAAVVTPPLSNQYPSPTGLARKPSLAKPQQPRIGIRKRKTESMASAESQTPKYRTRSMIIVYYDSAVQNAFEDLVKFVSASRNSMRKGKMNAKMEAMRRAAEKEVDNDTEQTPQFAFASSRTLSKEQNTPSAEGHGSVTPGNIAPTMEADDDDGEVDLSKLKFKSTRNMGPPRTYGSYNAPSPMGAGMMRSARSSAGSSEPSDIFDELDKGLEWCQSQCERAAHQFLRDGDCSDEIEGIKKRLLQVKEKAEQEVQRLKKEEAENPTPPRRDAGKSRELRSPQMRKAIGMPKAPELDKKVPGVEKKVAHAQLEVDKMEVDDDEGYEDVDLPPVMAYRRTRDMGRS